MLISIGAFGILSLLMLGFILSAEAVAFVTVKSKNRR